MNLYEYAAAMPIDLIDPLGTSTCKPYLLNRTPPWAKDHAFKTTPWPLHSALLGRALIQAGDTGWAGVAKAAFIRIKWFQNLFIPPAWEIARHEFGGSIICTEPDDPCGECNITFAKSGSYKAEKGEVASAVAGEPSQSGNTLTISFEWSAAGAGYNLTANAGGAYGGFGWGVASSGPSHANNFASFTWICTRQTLVFPPLSHPGLNFIDAQHTEFGDSWRH